MACIIKQVVNLKRRPCIIYDTRNCETPDIPPLCPILDSTPRNPCPTYICKMGSSLSKVSDFVEYTATHVPHLAADVVDAIDNTVYEASTMLDNAVSNTAEAIDDAVLSTVRSVDDNLASWLETANTAEKVNLYVSSICFITLLFTWTNCRFN